MCATCASPVLVNTGCTRAHVHETNCTAREGLAAIGTACNLVKEGRPRKDRREGGGRGERKDRRRGRMREDEMNREDTKYRTINV